MAIKIVVDSGSDLELSTAKELGVTLLPLEITFSGKSYMAGVDITNRRFYEMLIESNEIPKTSQINEFRFDECFKALTADGSEVIAIVLSSKLSGTYDSALKAAAGYCGKVFVVDSKNVCIGERILLEYALRLVQKGVSATEIVAELEVRKQEIKVMAVVGTLKYLQKGGRLTKAAAFAGEMIGVKPVIAIEDGEIKVLGKAIGSKKSNNLLNRLVLECGGIDFTMPYATAYSGLDDSLLNKYIDDSKELYSEHASSVPKYVVGSTIGTHAGPGAIAVAFFKSRE